MNRTVIAISSIGSGVGQSIINACRLSSLPLRTVGLGTNPFAFGAYDCDAMDYLPTIYAEGYVGALIAKCKEHRATLVIPGLDDEVLFLAQAEAQFKAAGIKVMTADARLIQLCRDKERMSRELSRYADIFVASYDLAGVRKALATGEAAFPLIAKPRGGFASRGILILLEDRDLDGVGEHHIVQELAIPHPDDPNHAGYMDALKRRVNPQFAEISIQLVADRQGDLIGRMASYNKLHEGVPIEVIGYDNKQLWTAIDLLYPKLKELGLRGPLNIQGRMTARGLKIFEMNPRFTGITGLRAVMGFNEVETCINEWLDQIARVPPLQFNHRAFGCRQTADKSVSLERNARISGQYAVLNQSAVTALPVLLVTGGSGYLGRALVRALARQGRYRIWTLDRDQARTRNILADLPEVQCFDHAGLMHGSLSLGHVTVIVHCAFSLAHHGPDAMAESLTFTQELLTRASLHQVPAIVNISSQSVYGTKRPPPWVESQPTAPESHYALAKRAAELMTENVRRQNRQICCTSLRVATLTGGQDGMGEHELITKLVKQALNGQPLKVVGGQQRMTRLDVRDAISAVLHLLAIPATQWQPVYNVDAAESHTVLDLAKTVIELTAKETKAAPVGLIVEEKATQIAFGMSTTLLTADTPWHTQFSLTDTVASVVTYLAASQPTVVS